MRNIVVSFFVLAAAGVLASMSSPVATAQQAPTGAALPVSQGVPDRQTIGGLAAIVNDYPISQADVIERARLTIMSMGVRPTAEQQQQILFQSLEQLIDERLQIEEAGSYDLVVEDGRVDREMDEVSSRMGLSGPAFEAQLRESGIDPKSLREQLRAEIAWQEIIQGLYGAGIRISNNRINSERLRLQEGFTKQSFRLSEIFLFTGGEANIQQEALTAAATLVEQLKQGANFAMVAQRLSSSPTAATGGDKGWVTLEDLPTEIGNAVSTAAQPGLLPPIATADGVYIIALIDTQEAQDTQVTLDFAQVVEKTSNQAALDQFLAQSNSCDTLKQAADAKPNIDTFVAKDIALSGLSTDMQARLTGLGTGGLSDAFEGQLGTARILVCDRREGQVNLPPDEAIEGSLRQRELAMIADRSLRNLRREATIIRR